MLMYYHHTTYSREETRGTDIKDMGHALIVLGENEVRQFLGQTEAIRWESILLVRKYFGVNSSCVTFDF